MRYFYFICIFLLSSQLCAYSLFEEAVSGYSDDAGDEQSFKLNGYMRGVFYVGKVPDIEEAETKSGYGGAALKLRVYKQDFGDGFAEIRFRCGNEFNEYVSEIDVREAYVNTYAGPFDFRIGHQIVVWGRADGFNPTDNITPKNMFVRSPDEDDRRKGNFLTRTFYNLKPFRMEGIWVPFYASSVLPTGIMSFPAGMSLAEPDYPDASLKNSSFAVKLNLEMASMDGSVSYFSGYNPFPGLDADTIEIVARAYKTHIAGADFSTIISSYGLRGEVAYRYPYEDYEENIYISNPDIQYIIGFDTEFGDLSIILQYIGKYIFDYTELTEPQTPEQILTYELALKNRTFHSQLNEISHAISFRPALNLMYETLTLEVLGLYHFTTEEFFIKPKISYDIADAMTVIVGGELYTGPDKTLFGTIDETLSSLFMELKTSF
ncbi:hypothetical protein KAW18_00520 [candidate division WOR-3 bacterium]|nr:hypothetical protein [candidate division WOR-3 bacterium]